MQDVQRSVIATNDPFGKWLLQQTDRSGFIGQLAAMAKADRGFDQQADPDAVRQRLSAMGADGDQFEAVDDAELEWLAL